MASDSLMLFLDLLKVRYRRLVSLLHLFNLLLNFLFLDKLPSFLFFMNSIEFVCELFLKANFWRI